MNTSPASRTLAWLYHQRGRIKVKLEDNSADEDFPLALALNLNDARIAGGYALRVLELPLCQWATGMLPCSIAHLEVRPGHDNGFRLARTSLDL